MKTLAIQKFLREHPEDWYSLLKKSPFELIISEYPDGRVLFKYVQFASDFTNELVCEARGIILQKGTWDIVCLPFSKFFNFGEPNAYSLNLLNSTIIEKIDGSIIKVYCYKGKWRVATNGTIEAEDATTYDDKTTFEDLFFDVLSLAKFEELTSSLYKDTTYLFELIHPMNRVVVDYHEKKELIFIGARCNISFVDDNIFQLQYRFVDQFDVIRLPKLYAINIHDLSELSAIADKVNISGADFEGFVVAEANDFEVIGRVKIKSPKYLKLHRLTGGEGISNNIINILLDGEQDEFEAYINQLPVYIKDIYDKTKVKFERLIAQLESYFKAYKDLSESVTRKEVALNIFKTVPKGWSGFIFTHIDHGGTPLNILKGKITTKKLKYLLEDL